ncbi:MAG: FHA domain-containing protein [Pyrinomonadaceae bacterium]
MDTDSKSPATQTRITTDWFVRGVLTKFGEFVDRVTGRGWNLSSSLATSGLIEKLKQLLDSEAKRSANGAVFVPHKIWLKMQWDKFSTDSDTSLESLRDELHASVIDHINDRLYHTYAPIVIEIKTDYFTEGVKLLCSFGEFGTGENDEASINVAVSKTTDPIKDSDGKISVVLNQAEIDSEVRTFEARFAIAGVQQVETLKFAEKRRISVGRSKQNDVQIADSSVSKLHASLSLDENLNLVVADIGSTNGTFVNGERIGYGEVVKVGAQEVIEFGTVSVEFIRFRPRNKTPDEIGQRQIAQPTEQFSGEFSVAENKAVQERSKDLAVPENSSSAQPLPANTEAFETNSVDFREDISKEAKTTKGKDLDKTQDWEV